MNYHTTKRLMADQAKVNRPRHRTQRAAEQLAVRQFEEERERGLGGEVTVLSAEIRGGDSLCQCPKCRLLREVLGGITDPEKREVMGEALGAKGQVH